MSPKTDKTPNVLRYVYAMLLIIVATVGAAIVSLYMGQNAEIMTRDRVQSFHLEAAAQAEELAREVRTLEDLVRDVVESTVSRQSGAAGVYSMQIGYRGVLYSMRSRIAQLSTIHEQNEQHGGVIFSAALERLVDRFNNVDRALDGLQTTTESINSIEVLRANIEQYDRLHKIAADRELRELNYRFSQRPRYLAVLAICLSFGALAVFYLTSTLRASILRQRRTEAVLEETRERLHHIQKLDALGRLVGGVTHDFNNQLTAILGHAELLQDHATGDDDLDRGLDEIVQASLRAAALTKQLLTFSRRQPLAPVVLNLNDAIRPLEPMLQRIIGSDVNLICTYTDDIYPVEVDPDQLQQLIMNLIGNARDAMPHGGEISIATQNASVGSGEAAVTGMTEGEYARLSIADTGVGMDKHTRERLFEPFFTTKEEGSGTGLGLSTAHGFVASSNGQILVDSEEGVGSQFHVYLPRAAAHAEESVSQSGFETDLAAADDEQQRRFADS